MLVQQEIFNNKLFTKKCWTNKQLTTQTHLSYFIAEKLLLQCMEKTEH